jgi:hypothetical protein
MAYEYDIFISYKRDEPSDTLTWINDHFKRILSHHVAQELDGGRINVFVDDKKIEPGDSWELKIGVALGKSRIIVPLWSRNYFHSKWCVLELSQMLAREKSEGFRTGIQSGGLVVPVVIHDGEEFPDYVKDIARLEARKFYKITMNQRSQTAMELEDVLKEKAKVFSQAIKRAPRWKKQWALEGAQAFYDALFRDFAPKQKQKPTYT